MPSSQACDTCFDLDQHLYDQTEKESKNKIASSVGQLGLLAHHRVTPCPTQASFRQSAKQGCSVCNLIQQACSLLPPLLTSEGPYSLAELQLAPNSPPIIAAHHPRVKVEIYAARVPEHLLVPCLSSLNGNDLLSNNKIRKTSKFYKLLQSRGIPPRSDSEDSFRFLIRQYTNCLQNHKSCQQQASALPRRVVDISGPTFCLIEPNSDQKHPYAALSYRWGSTIHLKTTRENIDKMKEGVDWEKVPSVFRNAANIAQKLAIRYLWIDALCIIQDDEIDWESEVAKMAMIYENSHITIAASSSQDPSDPFLGERKWKPHEIALDSEESSVLFRARDAVTFGHHFSHPWDLKDPLDRRGWALQERELPTRCVSYTSAELQWRCKTIRACECRRFTSDVSTNPASLFDWESVRGNTSPGYMDQRPLVFKVASKFSRIIRLSSIFELQNDLKSPVLTNSKHYLYWQVYVEKYTERELTKVRDKLPAMIGLASRFRQLLNSEYFCGLWKNNLPTDLAWARESSGYIKSKFAPIEVPSGPSYSWASLPGPITYRRIGVHYRGPRTYHTQLVPSKSPMQSVFTFESEKKACLTLCGTTVAGGLSSSNPMLDRYRVDIAGEVFPSLETIMDAPFKPCHTFVSDRLWPQCLEATAEGQVFGFKNYPIKLLSLFTLQDKDGHANLEFMIILKRSSVIPGSYQRLGLAVWTSKDHEVTPLRPFEELRREHDDRIKITEAEEITIL